MPAIVILNGSLGEPEDPVPHKGDGSPYRFEMTFDSGHYLAYADGVDELCAELVPGYVDLESEDERAAARVLYATEERIRLQAGLNGLVADADAVATPAEQEILLAAAAAAAATTAADDDDDAAGDWPPAIEVWEADVPLVLVDTDYQPYGPLPRPVGRPRGGGAEDSNLIWLRPADEAQLISSLDAAGLISLGELTPGSEDGSE